MWEAQWLHQKHRAGWVRTLTAGRHLDLQFSSFQYLDHCSTYILNVCIQHRVRRDRSGGWKTHTPLQSLDNAGPLWLWTASYVLLWSWLPVTLVSAEATSPPKTSLAVFYVWKTSCSKQFHRGLQVWTPSHKTSIKSIRCWPSAGRRGDLYPIKQDCCPRFGGVYTLSTPRPSWDGFVKLPVIPTSKNCDFLLVSSVSSSSFHVGERDRPREGESTDLQITAAYALSDICSPEFL